MRVDDMRVFYLEHDETFLQKIAKARDPIKRGEFVFLDDLPDRSGGQQADAYL